MQKSCGQHNLLAVLTANEQEEAAIETADSGLLLFVYSHVCLKTIIVVFAVVDTLMSLGGCFCFRIGFTTAGVTAGTFLLLLLLLL